MVNEETLVKIKVCTISKKIFSQMEFVHYTNPEWKDAEIVGWAKWGEGRVMIKTMFNEYRLDGINNVPPDTRQIFVV